MDFERRYPHPKLQYEYFVVRWTRGYRSAELWYNNRLVIAVSEIDKLLKGVKIHDEILGPVVFKLEEDPYVLNVIVDGYHSKRNSKHPSKGIKSVSNWMLPGIIYYLFAVFISLSFVDKIVLYLHVAALVFLVVAFVLIRYVSPAFLFIGLVVYLLQLYVYTSNILQYYSIHFFTLLLYLGYFAYVIALTLPTLRVIRYLQHKKYDFTYDPDVLDN